jgi:hypothetical protein
MVSCAYLRRQAALCLRIAAAVDDQSVVAALVLMAEEFSAKADEVDPSLNATSLSPTSLHATSLRSASLGPRGLDSNHPAKMRHAVADG